ncbi:MAG: outer membrane protein assembly factor BamD [Deltaproteobacteria bacterium]|nr:outer membrane protein assembly factor BamD [Deltaproteobacteria bacterium]
MRSLRRPRGWTGARFAASLGEMLNSKTPRPGPSPIRAGAAARPLTKPAARLRCLGLAGLLACLVCACGSPAIRPENELFREGSLAFEEESYNSAIEDYKVMLEQYPFSDKAEIASLNIAHAYFLTGEFSKAIDAFNDFERLYPVSPLLPFVGYTIGMCYLEQSNTSDRDSSASEAALRQFEKLGHQFPKSLWADLARHRAAQARESLGSHELVVGDYYRERERQEAAAGRYRFVIRKYPGTQAAVRAEQRLASVPAAPPQTAR